MFASCTLADDHSTVDSAVDLSLVPSYPTQGGAFSCTITANRAIQLDRSALPGNGTRLAFHTSDSYADAPADAPALWAFAVPTHQPAPLPTAPTIRLTATTYALGHSL